MPVVVVVDKMELELLEPVVGRLGLMKTVAGTMEALLELALAAADRLEELLGPEVVGTMEPFEDVAAGETEPMETVVGTMGRLETVAGTKEQLGPAVVDKELELVGPAVADKELEPVGPVVVGMIVMGESAGGTTEPLGSVAAGDEEELLEFVADKKELHETAADAAEKEKIAGRLEEPPEHFVDRMELVDAAVVGRRTKQPVVDDLLTINSTLITGNSSTF